MLKEDAIIYDKDKFWVLKLGDTYEVRKDVGTHSITDSVYASTDLAIARCDYLAKKEIVKCN
jgi:hypothetical protein